MKLILMPGMDGTGELFAPLIHALGNSMESSVLRYPPDEPLGYSELLTRVRAELPKSDSFVLLGESFSGPLALMLTAEAPDSHDHCLTSVRLPTPILRSIRSMQQFPCDQSGCLPVSRPVS